MLLNVMLALTAYFLFSFLLTAMLVRFARKSQVARMSRKRFYFFPFAPIMLVVQLVAVFIKWAFIILIAYPFRLIQRAFELLSGHKPRRRKSYYRY